MNLDAATESNAFARTAVSVVDESYPINDTQSGHRKREMGLSE